MPNVSIVTATYNRSSTLPRAIESVLSQTYADFEHIIVDDGSDDSTPEVVNRYDDSRITYIRLDENRGANAARNIGIKEASGDYISILDSDDEYHPKRIERMISAIQNVPSAVGAVCHSYQRVSNNTPDSIKSVPQGMFSLDELRHGNAIGSFLGVLFKADLFTKIGNLDEKMVASQDYEYYLRVAREYSFFGVSDVLGLHYRLSESIGANTFRTQRAYRQVRQRHGDILSKHQAAKYKYTLFQHYAEQENVSQAKKALLDSVRLNPRNPVLYYYLIFSILGENGIQMAERLKNHISKRLLSS